MTDDRERRLTEACEKARRRGLRVFVEFGDPGARSYMVLDSGRRLVAALGSLEQLELLLEFGPAGGNGGATPLTPGPITFT